MGLEIEGFLHIVLNSLFVFGTLLNVNVRRRVLGRIISDRALPVAAARGFDRFYIQNRSYPMLKPCPAGRVTGAILGRLSAPDWKRLDDYEGPEYGRAPIAVWRKSGKRQVVWAYLGQPGVVASARRWRPKPYCFRSRIFCQ